MASAKSALHELCDVLEGCLDGPTRHEIVDAIVGQGTGRDADAGDALGRLRSALSDQSFEAGEERLDFAPLVQTLDQRTRLEGFRVLHSWDHTSHRFTDDITPVLMLDHFSQEAGESPNVRVVCEILLDYYFLHLLALCAMRVWDDDDPDAAVARVTYLVGHLQSAHGSGHRFVDDAETLIIYAVSQFHPEDQAYGRLIEKVTGFDPSRQVRFAIASASVLSSHLRWGFWLMYDRDVLRMRADNVADYPWLLNSVLTLMREYAALRDADDPADAVHRFRVLDGLLQGLAADPWAFTGKAPMALTDYGAQHAELRDLLTRYGNDLLAELEAHRPSKTSYAPLALHYNFPHNTLVALVSMALLAGEPQSLPINTLFVREHGEEGDDGVRGVDAAERLARSLMEYSGGSPDRLGFKGAMLVAYDPLSGLRTFAIITKALREYLGGE